MSLLDDPLVRSVEDGSLPASAFHHREHVYLTWCYLRSLPLQGGRVLTSLRREDLE